jgi:hypothetical protein
MAVYDRKCTACDELFEVSCRIADKDTAVFNCPYCDSVDGVYLPSAPNTSIRPDRLMTAKKDAGFGEVISKIKERNKRTSISKR